MNSILLKLSIFLFITLLNQSCVKQSVEIGEISNLRIIHMYNYKIDCTADISLNNKSFLPFTIENGQLLAYLGDMEIGIFTITKAIKLSSFERNILPIHFTINFNNADMVIILATNFMLGKKNEYNLKGTLTAKSYFIQKKISIDKTFVK